MTGRGSYHVRVVATLVVLSLLAMACSTADDAEPVSDPAAADVEEAPEPEPEPAADPEPEPEPEAEPEPPTAGPAVDPLFASLTEWDPEVVSVEDERELATGEFVSGDYAYQCEVTTSDPTERTFDAFPAIAFEGSVLPGLFVDGDRLLTGDIQPLPLDRAPLELAVDLASSAPVVDVQAPSTATLQQAVAALQRDADSRLSGIDVVPADIDYVRREAYSFEQTALDLGVSLRYDGALASAGLDTAFAADRSFEQHTILVRMVQPMYTISFVDDGVIRPSQLLAPSITPDTVDQAIEAGRLREGSPAVYIESVTYGRTMLFTMSSTRVESAEELQVAMNAAYRSISGEVEVGEEERRVLAESEIRLVAVGGDTAAAEAAIRSADPAAFFSGADTANAAPLTFRVATLGGQTATVRDVASYQQQDCARSLITTPEPESSFTFVFSDVIGRATLEVNGRERLEVRSTPGFPSHAPGYGEITLAPGDLASGSQEVRITFGRPQCVGSRVSLRVVVDGVFEDERNFDGCAFNGVWEYSVDKASGELVRLR